jgi:hypothetical protein
VRRRRQLRQVVSALAAVSVFAGGCTDEPAPFPTATSAPAPVPTEAVTLAPEPLPSPTVSAIDVSVVPPVDQMTIEYVEAVVNAIEAENGKLFAAVLAAPINPLGATPAGTLEGLEQLFGEDRLQLLVEEAESLAGDETARESVLHSESFTGVTYEVLQVSYAEAGCMIAVARVDRTGSRVAGGPDPVLSVLSFGLTDAAVGLNPTPWRVLDSTPNENSDGVANDDSFAFGANLTDMSGFIPNDCVSGEASRVG